MASFMTALGSMGSAITSTKDVYKPTDNIASSWSSLAQNLVAVAGTVGLTALANNLAPKSGLTPTLVRGPGGTPIPTIYQPGVQGGQMIGSAVGSLTPAQMQTGLYVAAGIVIVGIVILLVARKG